VNPPAAHDRRQRRVLIGLALMFFGPLGVSFYMYYGHGSWHPGGRVNAGNLIVPPRPLPFLALPLQNSGETDSSFLRRKWTLLYVQQGACAEHCRTSLYQMRQVRLALDRDMDRVQRVFIGDADCCDLQFLHTQHPDLIAVRMSPAAAPLLALLPHRGPGNASAGANDVNAEDIYLIDPLGNLMMSYAPDAKPKGMLEDMKRLLHLSHIG
jgi:hypothetical protein